MALNFKETAKRVGAQEDELIVSRTKAKLDTVVGEVLTLEGVARTRYEKDGEKGSYPAICFKEYPNNYFSGGTLFERALFAWAEETGCPTDDDEDCPYYDFGPLNAELANQTVQVTFYKSTKRNGQPLNKFRVM